MSSISPLPFSYGRLEYVALGSDSEYNDDALQEVDLSALGYARYTVYRITAAAKRVIHDNEVPVFQFDTGGNGTFAAVTPSEIWYPVGYIVLSSARGATDVGRVHSGHYCAASQIFGCVLREFSDKTVCKECTCDTDTAIRRGPVYDDWSGRLEAFWAKKCSERTTDTGAANGHITLTHLDGGTAGDAISLEITNPGGNGALTVTVTGSDIVVAAGRSGGTITSKAVDVIQAINSNLDAIALKAQAKIPAGETGQGLVAVYTHTHLEGGADKIDLASLKGQTLVVKFYSNYSTGLMDAGYCVVESLDWSANPTDFVKATLGVSGARHRLYRVPE